MACPIPEASSDGPDCFAKIFEMWSTQMPGLLQCEQIIIASGDAGDDRCYVPHYLVMVAY